MLFAVGKAGDHNGGEDEDSACHQGEGQSVGACQYRDQTGNYRAKGHCHGNERGIQLLQTSGTDHPAQHCRQQHDAHQRAQKQRRKGELQIFHKQERVGGRDGLASRREQNKKRERQPWKMPSTGINLTKPIS